MSFKLQKYGAHKLKAISTWYDLGNTKKGKPSHSPNAELDSLVNLSKSVGSRLAVAAAPWVSPLSHVRDNCINKSPACSPHCDTLT